MECEECETEARTYSWAYARYLLNGKWVKLYSELCQKCLKGKPDTSVIVEKKIGRNDPCPCNSGKKYKKCHGR